MRLIDRAALEALKLRLRTILPEEYQDLDKEVKPVSMGSAGLKFAPDGQVAWNEIWGSFCDLAMAGGPPHKGTLLEPGSLSEIHAAPDRYGEVVDEICRGATLTTDLAVEPAPDLGWVRVECHTGAMAGWLLRAIVMENVAVRREGRMIDLPAAPGYRLEKEIKNVITVIAKTCHYWLGHMPRAQQREIGALFEALDAETPLLEPIVAQDVVDSGAHERLAAQMADAIRAETSLARSRHRYLGWLGLDAGRVDAAIWMMRMLVASNVLARREDTVLFVPIHPVNDPGGKRAIQTVSRVHDLERQREP